MSSETDNIAHHSRQVYNKVMTIFFTSDTHFGHANILNLGDGRPFDDIYDHNEGLISRWNQVVQPDDSVWHLGDVALGKIADTLPLVARLNGNKVLFPGNHDRISSAMSKSQNERFGPIYSQYFEDIMPEIVQTRFSLNSGWDASELITVSHYPPVGDSGLSDRYSALRPAHTPGAVYIAGHTHTRDRFTITDQGAIIINVGVDARDFAPVSLDVVMSDISDARRVLALQS